MKIKDLERVVESYYIEVTAPDNRSVSNALKEAGFRLVGDYFDLTEAFYYSFAGSLDHGLGALDYALSTTKSPESENSIMFQYVPLSIPYIKEDGRTDYYVPPEAKAILFIEDVVRYLRQKGISAGLYRRTISNRGDSIEPIPVLTLVAA